MVRMRTRSTALFTTLLISLGIHAEEFHLKDGEVVRGTLQSLDEKEYTVLLEGGVERKLDKTRVARIEVSKPSAAKSPAPKAEDPESKEKYDTPKRTFETWRMAAVRGDTKAMVECYAKYRKSSIQKDLKKISRDKRKEMSTVAAQTDFTVGDPVYQGDIATLEVTWRMGLATDVQVLQFTLEGKDWKIIQ